MKKINEEIEKSYKRMSLIVIIWSTLGFFALIPCIDIKEEPIWMICVVAWMIWSLIGILLSPKIVNKIWK
jgi:hypothetical protein